MRGAGGPGGMSKTLLARALYDNHPDCSDELAFCRGDILTVLEQNVPESEGWWKCLLHGRQGLAPANRLQVLEEAPADRPGPPFLRALEDGPASCQESYQVPAVPSPPTPGPVYEQMKSWVEGPPPPTVQVYEFPDPPARARIVCEKTLSFPRQAIFTIPRAARTSLPALPCQVYDVPAQSRCPPASKEPGKQQLYDIPPRPQRAALSPLSGQSDGQDVPLTSATAFRRGSCHTLPNPQKLEWIYDTPVSLEKAGVPKTPLANSGEESGPHGLPRYMSSFHSPPNSIARSLPPHAQKNGPMQKKLSLPEIPSYSFPPPKSTCPLDESVSYKVPSSFLIPRMEQQNTMPNIYDVPRALPSVPQAGKELGKAGPLENPLDRSSAWFCGRAASLSPEPDSLSVSSSDSRASVLSSCSSTSTDSSSSSFSEEPAKELPLDLDLAKETVTALQRKVASSVSSLMHFVSRKWRFRDCLEANIDSIRRAADHIEESLREFLDFAHGLRGTAGNLADSNLQAKIRDQLQTLSNSYQILLETKESLESCGWSLEVLVTDKVQNSPDDLERFVLVARMVPEDIKRFASIIIANGRLLFKPHYEKEEPALWAPNAEFKLATCIQPPGRQGGSDQRKAPFHKQRQSQHPPELLEKNKTNVSEQNPGSLGPQPLSQQNPEKKIHLSEHCRLYFGALLKGIGVLNSSLSAGQPPETFIAQSKLVIMVGQKLVDTLCKETQDRDFRNEILCGSSHLCSLLRDLALATKHAVLEHPSPAALGRLQAEAQRLEQHTQRFRGTLE
uniref:Cas scaffolding protein family member 4 n=1 Tax=Catagonus wagneri TaxID=51154 RepID=A0A8C3VQM5_9CETA